MPYPVLIALAVSGSPAEPHNLETFLAKERADCAHSMRALGYRERRVASICECYIEQLEQLMEQDNPDGGIAPEPLDSCI